MVVFGVVGVTRTTGTTLEHQIVGWLTVIGSCVAIVVVDVILFFLFFELLLLVMFMYMGVVVRATRGSLATNSLA